MHLRSIGILAAHLVREPCRPYRSPSVLLELAPPLNRTFVPQCSPGALPSSNPPGNNPMPQVLIRHKVSDYAGWKRLFDEHSATRASYGSQGGRVFRNADDSDEVLMLLEVEDLDRLREFVASPELRETMSKGGVTDRPDVYFLDHEEQVEA